MHGCNSASACVVNAEVDLMGGVVEGGVGVGTKTSPRHAAIEKVQAELRQEYDVREERRRELEFLEKGGNPLDFNFGKATSVSVQSTSLANQQPEPFVTSEAKGSFPFTTSPHGDSVESSGRPGAHSAFEPNSADNLMLFDTENDFVEGDRNSAHPSRTNIAPTEHSSQQDGTHNAKELGDSASFGLTKKAYTRRSRHSRDGVRQSSTDAVFGRGCQGSSLSSQPGSKDARGLATEEEKVKGLKVFSSCDSKPMSPNGVMVSKPVPSEGQLEMELDSVKALESATNLIKSDLQDNVASSNISNVQNDQYDQQSDFDTHKSPEVVLGETRFDKEKEEVVPMDLECQPHMPRMEAENQTGPGQVDGFSNTKEDDKRLLYDAQNNSAAPGTKVLDSESSCTQTSASLDGNNDGEMCTVIKIVGSNGNFKEHTYVIPQKSTVEGHSIIEKSKEIKVDDSSNFTDNEYISTQRNHRENGLVSKAQEDINEGASGLQDNGEDQNQNELKNQIAESMETDHCNGSGSATEISTVPSGDNLDPSNENVCSLRPEGLTDSSVLKLLKNVSPARMLVVAPVGHKSSDMNSEASKVDEDSILEEARIIEAKRKRISELSTANLPSRSCRKSHWDFVLEEMSWLANDFAQERIWKLTAAAKICHQVASTSRLRFLERNDCWKHKKVAHILASAVMEFWLSVEEGRDVQALQCSRKDGSLALREYAVKILKYNNFDVLHTQAEAPLTPDRISDFEISGISWEDRLTEENLFYTVLPGATETYRRSIESHVVKYEKTGSSIQEELETSACDVVADFGSQDNAYDEDEGETSAYDTSVAFEGSRSRFAQKKWKNSTKAYNARTYEVVADSQYMQCTENKAGNQQLIIMGKRPSGSLNVSFPTKRMRTSNRQKVVSPFGAGTSTCIPMATKTDASSGDTSSFQDDQSTMHGGSHFPNNLEVESVGDFEKQLPFDSAEISSKNKKKKKAKHLGSAYKHRWQVDTNFKSEQRDYSKKRSDSHQLESNGLFGQHIAKKPKVMRQSLDTSYESGATIRGSASSPVTSQISSQHKIMKMLSSRDRCRKSKGLKIPTAEVGSGSLWSLFDEQALMVFVHDLGPNWELVSDAINCALQFKCIFRNAKECKERHKMLIERNGDGAESTEDSGSSQPYNSTLPGIPKGSARQLFQQLHGRIEEDALRGHFDKIIMLGQKLHVRRKQNDMQNPKQLQQPHSSHMFALSQCCPNYLSGGPVLTPLDLCDTASASPDMLSLGYQGQHTGGLAIANQCSMAPMLNGSAVNSSVPGSSNMIFGNNFSSSPGPVNPSVRDARYTVPRSASLSTEEQQRMQQYSQLLPGRNLSQSNSPSPGGLNDRGVRMLPGGNAVGITAGVNRNLPIGRPGFQGMASSPMLNSGNMISSGMVAIPSPVNMHPGVGSGQGNSIRPRDALHITRPSQNQDPQLHMSGSELQIQVSQGSNPGIAPYGTLSSSLPNQAGSPPVSSYPHHNQQSHGMPQQPPHVHHPHLQGTNHVGNPQHQAYTARLVKERQLQPQQQQQQQQRVLQQQQQQYASSNSMMSHVQSPSQLPISSPPLSSSQIQPQTSSPPVSLSPLTSASPVASLSQHQQTHQGLPHGLGRNAQGPNSGPTNQMSKQRQRQPQQQQFQQSGRHHPQQRQQTHTQQQTKIVKGVGRGNMIHQNIPMDPSLLNGLSTNAATQTAEQGEQAMHLLHGQGLYSGPGMNPVQTGKQLLPHSSNQSHPQHKIYASQVAPLAKHLQQIPSHSDSASQGHVSPVASSPVSAGHQSAQPLVGASSSHQNTQVELNQKLNQNQSSVQRVSQQSRHINSDVSTKRQGAESQTGQSSNSNASRGGAIAAMTKTSNDSTNGVQVLSSASVPQWRTSELLYDSSTSSPATNFSSVGTLSTISIGNEPLSQVGQKGLGQRQSSGTVPPVGLDVSAQWQPQPSQLQQSPSPVSQQQQLASHQQLQLPSHQQLQLPSHQRSQPQTQLGGNGSNLFVRPTDSRLE